MWRLRWPSGRKIAHLWLPKATAFGYKSSRQQPAVLSVEEINPRSKEVHDPVSLGAGRGWIEAANYLQEGLRSFYTSNNYSAKTKNISKLSISSHALYIIYNI